jgi:hypothetical protein
MRYWESLTKFFEHSNWTMNILLEGVCALIPAVGPIALAGYNLGVIVHLHERRESEYPAFDFGRFVDYLKRGLWPFLVSLVLGFISAPIAWLLMGLAFAGFALSPTLGVVLTAVAGVLFLWLVVGIHVCIMALTLRAGLMQDFGAGFSLAFLRGFLGRVWVEAVLAMLFMCVVAIPLTLAGFLAMCVGVYAAAALMTFIHWQLNLQLYELYLERGGDPLPISVELMADP